MVPVNIPLKPYWIYTQFDKVFKFKFEVFLELSTLNGKTIALVGDLKNGRTVHSLAKILCLYNDITFHYVSPTEGLGMPDEICDYVAQNSQFNQVLQLYIILGVTTISERHFWYQIFEKRI